jgi:hypothetical protein
MCVYGVCVDSQGSSERECWPSGTREACRWIIRCSAHSTTQAEDATHDATHLAFQLFVLWNVTSLPQTGAEESREQTGVTASPALISTLGGKFIIRARCRGGVWPDSRASSWLLRVYSEEGEEGGMLVAPPAHTLPSPPTTQPKPPPPPPPGAGGGGG